MKKARISIDDTAGFCWGVVKTIDKVEEVLAQYPGDAIYVLGHIIHNPREIERLQEKGLETIAREELPQIKNSGAKVIIRAHGEPPSTYEIAEELGIELLDATCPLVKALQKRVKNYYEQGKQIVIFGKKEHAEVVGLRGFCNEECIVVRSVEEALEKVDFTRETVLVSQTTMDKRTFYKIKEALENNILKFHSDDKENAFITKDTICKFVFGREDKLREFCSVNDVVLFVAGKNSSNGKSLFNVCRSVNDRTFFIEDASEINIQWLAGAFKIGITGATSTPLWYLNFVSEFVTNILEEENERNN